MAIFETDCGACGQPGVELLDPDGNAAVSEAERTRRAHVKRAISTYRFVQSLGDAIGGAG